MFINIQNKFYIQVYKETCLTKMNNIFVMDFRDISRNCVPIFGKNEQNKTLKIQNPSSQIKFSAFPLETKGRAFPCKCDFLMLRQNSLCDKTTLLGYNGP